jgi:hypothetical protein
MGKFFNFEGRITKMVKKLLTVGMILVIASVVLAGVMNYVPQNANLVVLFQNNGANYDALKGNVPVFSFLLNDLGLESLVQSSVSNTANSLNLKSSQIWSATLNDFVIFGNENQKDIAVVMKADPSALVKFFQSLIGGQIGSVNVNGKKFQSFTINGMTLYFYGDSGYTIASNSTSMIIDALNASSSKGFSFSVNYPKNAWFEAYWNGNLPMTAATDVVTQKNGYAYGIVSNGMLSIYGKENLDYKDSNLKAQITSSKPNSTSLVTNQATGDLWVAIDVPNPSAFYDVLKPYIKDIKVGSIEDTVTKDFVDHFSGKVFADMSLLSGNNDFVATAYLTKDLSSYIPELSKSASATFTWQGHTVLRDDTVEGTRTTFMYTIFYPDKVVLSNMDPDSCVKYIASGKPAQSLGNYSSFSSQMWNNSVLTIYGNVGSFIENALQYNVDSGIVVQARSDNSGNLEFQMLVK